MILSDGADTAVAPAAEADLPAQSLPYNELLAALSKRN